MTRLFFEHPSWLGLFSVSAEALRNALAAKHSLIGRRLLERHEVSFVALPPSSRGR